MWARRWRAGIARQEAHCMWCHLPLLLLPLLCVSHAGFAGVTEPLPSLSRTAVEPVTDSIASNKAARSSDSDRGVGRLASMKQSVPAWRSRVVTFLRSDRALGADRSPTPRQGISGWRECWPDRDPGVWCSCMRQGRTGSGSFAVDGAWPGLVASPADRSPARSAAGAESRGGRVSKDDAAVHPASDAAKRPARRAPDLAEARSGSRPREALPGEKRQGRPERDRRSKSPVASCSFQRAPRNATGGMGERVGACPGASSRSCCSYDPTLAVKRFPKHKRAGVGRPWAPLARSLSAMAARAAEGADVKYRDGIHSWLVLGEFFFFFFFFSAPRG